MARFADIDRHEVAGDDDLRGRAVRGSAMTLMSQWVGLVLQLGSGLVLARLLLPSDYGLLAMVLPVIGLAELLRTLGLSDATVQSKTLSHAQVSTLFWLNVAVGTIAMGLLLLLAPLLAAFYDRAEVQGLTYALAPTILIASLGSQHSAVMARHLRFGSLATSEVTALLLGALTGIACAALGAGYWSLVAMQATTTATRVALYWRASAWRPGRPVRGAGVRRMLSFGLDVSLSQLLHYLSRNADNVLLGRVAGAVELGYYSRGYQLFLVPLERINRPISRVAIPTLSRLQSDPDRYRRYYLKAMRTIAVMSMPAMVFLAVLAPEIVFLLLGERWAATAPIVRVLALCGITQVIASANGWLYVSTGRTRRQLKWTLVSRPLIILSFLVGLPWGGVGVATAYTVANYVLLPWAFHNALKDTPVTMRQLVGVVWRPAMLSLGIAVAATTARLATSDWHPVATLGVAALAASVTYAVITLAWPTLRTESMATVRVFVDAARGRSKSRRAPASG